MVTASRMQDILQIRKNKLLFRDQTVVPILFVKFTFRALGVERTRGGAIAIECLRKNKFLFRDQTVFPCIVVKFTFRALGVEKTRGGVIAIECL